ncbi:MAG: acyloxyacyl hydrolase [Deltaproteobacteria bacterium]|nr:acyloxyacyl hydrolase [Deltaproteobacteria bacterium]MBW2017469.1 acyloxyacyl hydrolase [Deltaproteobacteria bacterium]MBW2130233.1 acyloxyacyl hydrolase [Deltaproteobacteria bacterium]MBW2304821.1 acyloxyacyl hydrolase [Deltaproteobacteria bacterium]
MARPYRLALLIMLTAAFFTFSSSAIAGETSADFSPSSIFCKDRITFQVVSGVLASPFALAARTLVLDYAQTNIRIGRMLNDPQERKYWFRGNTEVIFEISNSYIFKGFGHYIGGITGLVRYNFVHPDSRFIPYIQGGVGIVYNDAYKDMTQRAIGQAIEFTPQASVGFRYILNKHWSLDAEAMFHHISNARLAERNWGINAFGGFIGLTYYTDWLYTGSLLKKLMGE